VFVLQDRASDFGDVDLNVEDISDCGTEGSDVVKDWKRIHKKRLRKGKRRILRKRLRLKPKTVSKLAAGSVVEFAGPPASETLPPLPAARPKAPPRALTGEPWGPFLISPLKDAGIVVGWGATCGQHKTDAFPLQTCKKSFRFCGLSSDDCKRVAKTWCILGLDIPKNDSCGKEAHIALGRSFDSMTDVQLEAGLVRAAELYEVAR